MSELGRFQDAFAEALAGREEALAPWIAPGRTGRLAVYRNTVAKGCADALAAQFPSVARIVGEAWMRQAAVRFAADQPPSVPSLADYGEGFPDWLAGFAPAAGLPYLSALAQIDWARRNALFAPDHPALGPADFARFAPDDYARICAQLHPSAQLLWFGDGTPSLWAALQGDRAPDAAELPRDPQGLLLVRPNLRVAHRILDRDACAFLRACQQGLSLGEAGEAALGAQPGLPLADRFAELIAAGAFGGVTGMRLPTYDDQTTPPLRTQVP